MILNIIRDWLANLAGRNRPVKPIPLPGPAPKPAPAPGPAPDGQDTIDAAMLAAHNSARQARGLAPLAWSAALALSAGKHAAYMARHWTLSHEGIGDGDPWSRMHDAGYMYSRAGENIAAGQADVGAVMAAWMSDIPHRMNIMGQYHEMGAGMTRADDGTPYWCVDFGSTAMSVAGPLNIGPTTGMVPGHRISCAHLSLD
jgi:uncharacterized protein YkwD